MPSRRGDPSRLPALFFAPAGSRRRAGKAACISSDAAFVEAAPIDASRRFSENAVPFPIAPASERIPARSTRPASVTQPPSTRWGAPSAYWGPRSAFRVRIFHGHHPPYCQAAKKKQACSCRPPVHGLRAPQYCRLSLWEWTTRGFGYRCGCYERGRGTRF
jgi:hypothetical protein